MAVCFVQVSGLDNQGTRTVVMHSCTLSSQSIHRWRHHQSLPCFFQRPKHLWRVIRQKDAVVPKETFSVILFIMKKWETYVSSDMVLKIFYKHLEMCVGFLLTQLENMMVFQHKTNLWSPCEMRCLPSFGQGKTSHGTYILMLLELQKSHLRVCKYLQFPLMCTYRNCWVFNSQIM